MSQTKAQLLDGKSSSIQFSTGSASSPTVSFTGDTNTGIYSPGADQLALSTNGTGRLFINSSGSVGIGTSSVASTLHIVDSSFAGNGTIRLGGGGAFTGFYSTIYQDSQSNGKLLFNSVAGSGSVHGHQFQVDGTAAVTIDASRRVGIGSNAPQHLCQIAGTLAVDSYNDTSKTITLRPGFEANANGGMGLAAKDHSGAAPDGLGIYGTDGVSVHTANAGAFFERFRVDTEGRLLVGTSTGAGPALIQVVGNTVPGTIGGLGILDVRHNGAPASGDSVGQLRFVSTTNEGNFATITAVADAATGVNDYPGRLVFSTTLDGASSPTERMRITNAGTVVSYIPSATPDTLNVYNTTASAVRFYVTQGGTVFATNTTISAISDQRLKENIRDIDVGLNEILALKPRVFDWKKGCGKEIKNDKGFIAQEFEEVFPDLVDTWKGDVPEGEEPYKSVRQDLIPVLIKAIQEQQAMITELQTKVAALEAS